MRLGFNIPYGPGGRARGRSRGWPRPLRTRLQTVWTMIGCFIRRPTYSLRGSPDVASQRLCRVSTPLSAHLAAAATRTIGLGTSVLDMPFYNPVVLGRRLTSLDVLSGGRLRIGFGHGLVG